MEIYEINNIYENQMNDIIKNFKYLLLILISIFKIYFYFISINK